MRTSLLSFSVFVGLASANIHFNRVQPTCDFEGVGPSPCLKGQHCSRQNKCVPNVNNDNLYPKSYPGRIPEKRQAKYSTDGSCGPKFGNTICDPNSKVYSGSCCSQYGWCGNSVDHCGTGCISGCGGNNEPAITPVATTPAKPPTVAARPDGRCGKEFGGAGCDVNGEYGGCCSEYGYCGKTDGHCLPANGCQNGCTGATPTNPEEDEPVESTEPVLGKPHAEDAPGDDTGKQTTDGSCGAKNDNMICGNWEAGNCCSLYGFCGNSAGHCGEGCQSGDCLNAPTVPAPGPSPAPMAAKPGTIQIKGRSGVPAMHAGLLPNGKVVFLDKVENYTDLKLPNGQYAYSSEYDPVTQKLTPLAYKTNAFCSGGIFLADGRFGSFGGNGPLDWLDPTVGDGFKGIRYLRRSATDRSLDGKDWEELDTQLDTARWYASAQIMADGKIFVASGSLNGLDPTVAKNNNPTYEILNRDGTPQGRSIPMDLLEKHQPYYMYPFVHLLKDGNMFVFTSKSSQNFNLNNNAVVKEFPDLPGDYRTYPNTGGSVILPFSSQNNWNPDVVICGGGPYQDITAPCDPSCGRINPLNANANWEMDSMPEARGMVEGTLLPDGSVIWVNGMEEGAQGFELARKPTLDVLIYDPAQAKGKRFTKGPKSTIPRLYHSVALLLLDGTLLISGSNPVEMPVLQASAQYPYITDFRNEIYTPPYLQGNPTRPSNIVLSSKNLRANGSKFTIKFNTPASAKAVKVSLYYGGFVTHSVHMGHRMAFLDTAGFRAGQTAQTIEVTMPPNGNIAPPGPYVVYVMMDGVPGMGQFVQVS